MAFCWAIPTGKAIALGNGTFVRGGVCPREAFERLVDIFVAWLAERRRSLDPIRCFGLVHPAAVEQNDCSFTRTPRSLGDASHPFSSGESSPRIGDRNGRYTDLALLSLSGKI